MQRKIFHFHDKEKKQDHFYGSIKSIYEFKENVGISIHTLYRHDFKEPFENYRCKISCGEIRVSSIRKVTNLAKAKKAKLFVDDSSHSQES